MLNLANSAVTLQIENLHPDVDENILYETFLTYGNVLSIQIYRDPDTEESLGIADVTYQYNDDAKRAVHIVEGENIYGRPCRIVLSLTDSMRSHVGNLLVKNLHPTITTEEIHDTLSYFGEILSCKVQTDENGVSKGFAFFTFSRKLDAEKVVEVINGKMIRDKIVSVRMLVPRSLNNTREEYFINYSTRNVFDGRPLSVPLDQTNEDCLEFSRFPYQQTFFNQGMMNFMMNPNAQRPFMARPGNIIQNRWPPNVPYMTPRNNIVGMPANQNLMMTGLLQQNQRRDILVDPMMNQNRNARPITGNVQMNQARPQSNVVTNRRPPSQHNQQMISSDLNSTSTIANADSMEAKQLLGEKIYPLISKIAGDMAGKITGMFLELDNAELLYMIENENALRMKIDEALKVLNAHKGGDGEERNGRSITDNLQINQVRPQHKISTNGLPDSSQHPMPITKRIDEDSLLIDSHKTIVERNVNRVDDISMGHTAETPLHYELKQTSDDLMSMSSPQPNQHKGVPIDRVPLADVKSQLDNQSLGETIYALVHRIAGYTNAGKITDKLSELDKDELNYLIENEDALIKKIDETLLDINDEDNVRMKTQHKEFLDMYKSSLLSQLKEMECAINDYFSELQCISCDNRMMHQFDDFLSSFSR